MPTSPENRHQEPETKGTLLSFQTGEKIIIPKNSVESTENKARRILEQITTKTRGYMQEKAFDNYNSLKFNSVLGDFISETKFNRLLSELMREFTLVLIEEDLVEDKIKKYVKSFLDYFETNTSIQIPEIQNPGLVIAQLLEKMIFAGIDRNNPKLNEKEDLKYLANKDNKSIKNFLLVYQSCFELILKIFAEREEGIKKAKKEFKNRLAQLLPAISSSELDPQQINTLTQNINDLFSNYGIEMNIEKQR